MAGRIAVALLAAFCFGMVVCYLLAPKSIPLYGDETRGEAEVRIENALNDFMGWGGRHQYELHRRSSQSPYCEEGEYSTWRRSKQYFIKPEHRSPVAMKGTER